MSDKWVEVEAKTIDDAIKAGLKELNLEDATEANISILRDPKAEFLELEEQKPL